MSETDIVRSVLVALRAIGAKAWRQQVVKKKRMHSGENGLPDIGCIVPPHGLYLGLEVKTDEGKESEVQLEWHETARKLGAVVVTVRSAQEAVAVYQKARWVQE